MEPARNDKKLVDQFLDELVTDTPTLEALVISPRATLLRLAPAKTTAVYSDILLQLFGATSVDAAAALGRCCWKDNNDFLKAPSTLLKILHDPEYHVTQLICYAAILNTVLRNGYWNRDTVEALEREFQSGPKEYKGVVACALFGIDSPAVSLACRSVLSSAAHSADDAVN